MRNSRTLYVLAAFALAPPVLAADVSYRDASMGKSTAPSSGSAAAAVSPPSHEAKADRELFCRCAPTLVPKTDEAARSTVPEPLQDYGG